MDYQAEKRNATGGYRKIGPAVMLLLLTLVFLALPVPAHAAPAESCSWTGELDSDWHKAGNWDCDRVPAIGDDVVITRAANAPVISADAGVGGLTIELGAILTVSGTPALSVSGNWLNGGTFDAGTGTVIFVGGAVQTVQAAGSQQFSNIVVDANTTVRVGGPLVLGELGDQIPGGAVLDLTAFASNLTAEGPLSNYGTIRWARDVVFGSTAEFHLYNAAGDTIQYHGVAIEPAAESLGSTLVEVRGHQAQGCTDRPADPLMTRCYTIAPAQDQAATIRFWFEYDELSGQSVNAALRLWNDNGAGRWSSVGTGYIFSAPCTPGDACWFQAEQVSTFSRFGLGGSDPITREPTMITLRDFTASPAGRTSALLLLLAALVTLFGLLIFPGSRRRKSNGSDTLSESEFNYQSSDLMTLSSHAVQRTTPPTQDEDVQSARQLPGGHS